MIAELFGIYTGVIVNTATIIVGGFIGVLLGAHLSERLKETVMHGIGLSVLLIGMQMALEAENIIFVVISMALGGSIGESLSIEQNIEAMGRRLQANMGKENNQLVRSFIFATIVYCSGALSITGALTSGLAGEHSILYTKSIIDGVASIAFASTMGVGIVIAAFSVLFYEGALVALADSLSVLLTTDIVREVSAVGGVLIVAISLNILGLIKIKVANLVPAIIIIIFLVKFFAP
ncbi:MAG: DUF554 domain-containing protein [Dethiobacteria bacterium]|jgi:uncharacterized membrane protein YqgA involved in biofilm formation|nr:DUF554 domain-containing protein [Bacillota bacterium]